MAMTHENYIKDLLDMSTYIYVSRISCSIVFHKLVHNILRGTQTCTELEHSPPCNEATPNSHYSVNRKPSLDIILILLQPVQISTSYWFQFNTLLPSTPTSTLFTSYIQSFPSEIRALSSFPINTTPHIP